MKPSIAARVPVLIPPPIQEKLSDDTGLMRHPWVQWALSLIAIRCVVDTHANRVDPAGRYRGMRFPVGSMFRESDTGAEYIATLNEDGQQVWTYRSGVMEAPSLGDVPLDLGADDVGFQVRIIDYGHVAQWDGSGWLPIGSWGGYVQHFCLDPVEPGWVLCNGAVTNVLQCSAGVITEPVFTVPVEAGTFRKGGAYTGTVNAATGGALTGATDEESAHTHSIEHDHPLQVSGAIASILSTPIVQGGAGAGTLGDHTHDVDMVDYVGDSGAGSAHSHGVGTLAIDGSAEPANIEFLPYFRR